MGHDLKDAIAIVGMAGRFPGARDLDEYWRNLRDGVDSVRRLGPRELAALGVPAAVVADPAFVPVVAMPAGIDELDAPFFGISHREAEIMDPQHRLFLECCWEALESAGCVPDRFPGDIAVYGGATTSTYLLYNLVGNPRLAGAVDPLQLIVGNAVDSLTTRVSFKLDLRGQSHAVQCACSTALVAVHLACESLLNQQCDLALAGAVSINVGQLAGYHWQADSILSPDGHCRAFDAAARGTVFGGGVGVVALRRLDDALAAGDPVRAVIRGSAVNNDGATKAGFSTPSVEGEARAIAEALSVARVDVESLAYLEAHGTGTPLGDPVEVQALNRVFRAATTRRGFCALGTVKSNIGHLDVAAGVAGLIKTVLALENGAIPPSLHFDQPNPRIDFAASPFYVNRELVDWPAGATPRRAGVSAFGFGGTNAHVVLEEAPPVPRGAASRPARLLLLSARSAAALDSATERLAGFLRRMPESDPGRLGDVAWTLHSGRRVFGHRRILVCDSAATGVEIAAALAPANETAFDAAAPRQRAVAFLLPGQGAQHAGMARGVYDAEPMFRAELDRAADLLTPHLGLDLRRLLFPAAGAQAEADEQLRRTRLAQPALFAVEYALAKLWQSWGVEPRALLGHSVGEYVAACLAGVMPLSDALALVAARGRLIDALPAGAMLAVALGEQEMVERLAAADMPRGLALAAINEPRRVVVAGPPEAIDELERRLRAEGAVGGIETRRLHTSHAFHSPALEPAAAGLREALGRVRLSPPAIPFLSNVTGTWIRPEEATSVDYWVRHLLAPVRFADGLTALAEESDRLLLEVGPGRTLTALAARHAAGRPAIASLPHPRQDATDDYQHLLGAAGRLWLAGQTLDGLYRGQGCRRVPLPTYPFERRRYWIEPANPGAVYGVATAFGGQPAEPGAAASGQAGAEDQVASGVGAATAPDGQPGAVRQGPAGAGGAAGVGVGLALHPRPPLPTPFVAPGDEVEERVAAVWREVLGVAEVGVHDSFLDLGGDSLLATRLMARLRQEFAVELPIDRLFAQPTVAAVASSVVAATADRADQDELARMLALIEGLSEEELAEQLTSGGSEPRHQGGTQNG